MRREVHRTRQVAPPGPPLPTPELRRLAHLYVVEGPRRSGRTSVALALAAATPGAVVLDEAAVQRKAATAIGARFKVVPSADGLARMAPRLADAPAVILIRLPCEPAREDVLLEILNPVRRTRVRTAHPVTTEEAA